MAVQEVNLDVITKQYRERGPASKGYRAIHNLIKRNKTVDLRILLRDHTEKEVDSYLEIEARDNVDFLIDYFSILEIGLIADYFPNPLPRETQMETEYILKNEYVNKYFSEYYPLLLPRLLIKQISKPGNGKYFQKNNLDDSEILFERFLIFYQIVNNDYDIDQFLWFLDDGSTDGYSIDDFWNVLSNENRISYKLGSSNKHPLNSALWGFIKYIQFLSDFSDLIRDSKEDSLLQSAFWHHQSYWFENMKDRIGDIINKGIKSIRQSMEHPNVQALIYNNNSYLNSAEDIVNWKNDINKLDGVEADIKFLLDKKLGEPLMKFYKNI